MSTNDTEVWYVVQYKHKLDDDYGWYSESASYSTYESAREYIGRVQEVIEKAFDHRIVKKTLTEEVVTA